MEQHTDYALFATYSRTRSDALKRIRDSFQDAEIHSKHAMAIKLSDFQPGLEQVLEAPRHSVMEEIKHTFQQIEEIIHEHYPYLADTLSYQDLWDEVNREAFPTPKK